MRTIPMTRVSSSNIHSVGFDQKSQLLAVQFLSAPAPCHFGPVPAEIAAQLTGAESVGKAFCNLIRGKWHPLSPDAVAAALAEEPVYEGSTPD